MKLLIASSIVLGSITAVFIRDEMSFPTNLRIKRAVLEHRLVTRQRIDADLLEIIDPNSSKEII